MSSMKTTTNQSRQVWNTLCMGSMNSAGAFVNPSGIIMKSKCPYRILNAILGIFASNSQLMITSAKVYLGVNPRPSQLIK